MDVIFTSSDLELKHFAKQNALFTSDSDAGKIRLVIEDFTIKYNKNLLIKNFHFFHEKIHKDKNNKNECLNILNHLDQELFGKEDIEFLKNKFFHFLNFLFLKTTEKHLAQQNFKMKINEIIKFIEVSIIFEPQNLIIDKIQRIIFLNPKIKTVIEANCNKPGGSFIRDKLDFLMQKLQSFKNLCKSNPINKLEKANLSGFALNASNVSGLSAKSRSGKSDLSHQSFNMENSVNSTSNANLNLNKSGAKFSQLLNLGESANVHFFPKYKNSIFFRYSFNLIRHLYDLPLALNLKNKSNMSDDNNNNNNNSKYNGVFNQNKNNNFTGNSNRINFNNNFNINNNNIKKIDSFDSISDKKLKSLSSYNQPILEKNGNLHRHVTYNKNQNEGGGGNNSGYLFRNSSLEEETRNYFSKKNIGFFAFVDSLFNNKNCWFVRLFKSKKYNQNNNKESFLNIAYGKSNRTGLMPNKNYIKNVNSLSSISDEYSSHLILSTQNNKSQKNNYINSANSRSNLVQISTKQPNKSLMKKSLENILLKEFNESNKEFGRFFLHKNLQNFDLRCEKAILIQKHFRRYLSYKNYLLKIKDHLKFLLISSIEKIQAFYRSFIWRKKIKYKLLLEEILRSRLHGSIRLIVALRKFQGVKKFKQRFLICKIIQTREKACIRIQSSFRRFFLRKFFVNFLFKENNFHKITYPFKAERVQLKIYIPRPIDEKKGSFEIFSDEKILNFEFCNFRKIYVLYIDTNIIKPGKYRALMLVDGISTCDGRYPHVEFSDGFYYNIIDIKESKNEERKMRSKKNINEKSQYYLSKYGTSCNKKENKDFVINATNNNKNNSGYGNFLYDKINSSNNLKRNNKFLSNSPDKRINQYANLSNIDSLRLNNFNFFNYNNNENVLQQGPNSNQFPNFIAGADTNNINTNTNNNYFYALTDSINNVNTGASLREEQLETRNTWENQSYFSSKSNSNKTNDSNSEIKKNIENKSNSYNEVEINCYEMFNHEMQNKDVILNNHLRKDSYNTFDSNITNNEEYYFNESIHNYNELKRNLLPNEYNTKTISYMDRIRQCIKDESEAIYEEISN